MDILWMNNIAKRYLNSEECELIYSCGYLVVPKFFHGYFEAPNFLFTAIFILERESFF